MCVFTSAAKSVLLRPSVTAASGTETLARNGEFGLRGRGRAAPDIPVAAVERVVGVVPRLAVVDEDRP